MSEDIRHLPYSGRRYQVNQYGKILRDGEQLPTYSQAGHQWVELEWVLGKRSYLAALVVMVGFSQLDLPEHLLDEIEPLYRDQDSNNLAPANLLYRFKHGPLAAEDYPGFYYIPFYTGYALSETGEMVNVETGKYKSWSITQEGGPKNQTGGYLYSRVVTSTGRSVTLFLHRAMCLAFKPYTHDVMELVVNHKDGRPSNNSKDNLEWCTYQQNNIHAIETGLKPNNSIAPVAVLMKDLQTGEISRFPTIQACARHLGNPRGDFIRHRLEKCPSKVFADLKLFKYDDSSEWPQVDLNKIEICRAGHGSDIAARNVFTGQVVYFTGSEAGRDITGVKSATILRHLRENADIPVNGWNFRYMEFARDWPQHSDRHLQIYERYPIYPPDGAIATDANTGEEKFFTSTAEAANAFNLSKGGFWAAVSRQSLVQGKYKLRVFRLRENLSLPSEVIQSQK